MLVGNKTTRKKDEKACLPTSNLKFPFAGSCVSNLIYIRMGVSISFKRRGQMNVAEIGAKLEDMKKIKKRDRKRRKKVGNQLLCRQSMKSS